MCGFLGRGGGGGAGGKARGGGEGGRGGEGGGTGEKRRKGVDEGGREGTFFWHAGLCGERDGFGVGGNDGEVGSD